jgi:hypothetical protein
VHPEYPLTRTCLHRYEPFQLNFARRAVQILPQHGDGSAEATHKGLVLRAETETDFQSSIGILKDYYGDQIQIGSPTVQYHRSSQLEEPHMGVRVLCPQPHFAAVKADLLARGASILQEEVTGEFGLVRASAPLAKLLGYPEALAQLTGASAREVMWLSHYAPVERPPLLSQPEAARISGARSPPPQRPPDA